MNFITAINQRISVVLNESWNWFAGLHQEEWFVLLGIIAAFGFLCMRGFGNQGRT